MKSRKSTLIVALTISLILGCEHKDCGCVQPPAPLEGEWTLTKITYGLTQKTVTAAEAGYTETLSFGASSDTKGTYRRVLNGIPSQTSDYSLSFPSSGNSEGFVYFLVDTTQQTFRLTDNKLYLSERIPRGVTIADGSTYEYQRQ